MTLIYIDTNIYLDFLISGRPKRFAEEAFQIFNRALRCEFEIIISKKVKNELRPNIEGKESALLFQLLEPKLRPVDPSKQDEEDARNLEPVDTADALHAILARKHKAKFLVTQNIKHFQKFSKLIQPVRPSEL